MIFSPWKLWEQIFWKLLKMIMSTAKWSRELKHFVLLQFTFETLPLVLFPVTERNPKIFTFTEKGEKWKQSSASVLQWATTGNYPQWFSIKWLQFELCLASVLYLNLVHASFNKVYPEVSEKCKRGCVLGLRMLKKVSI